MDERIAPVRADRFFPDEPGDIVDWPTDGSAERSHGQTAKDAVSLVGRSLCGDGEAATNDERIRRNASSAKKPCGVCSATMEMTTESSARQLLASRVKSRWGQSRCAGEKKRMPR